MLFGKELSEAFGRSRAFPKLNRASGAVDIVRVRAVRLRKEQVLWLRINSPITEGEEYGYKMIEVLDQPLTTDFRARWER